MIKGVFILRERRKMTAKVNANFLENKTKSNYDMRAFYMEDYFRQYSFTK